MYFHNYDDKYDVKIYTEERFSRQSQTQSGNNTTDQKVKVDFFLTKFSVRKIVT